MPMRAVLFLLALASAASAQPALDGHLFDQGRAMTEPSPRADAALGHMSALLGQWDVAVTTHPTDSTTAEAEGTAEITYMNRGYAYQERRHVPGADGGETEDAMSFLVYTPAAALWALGEARATTEHVEVFDGTASADGLVLTTAVRRGGGTRLTHLRISYVFDGPDAFGVAQAASTDGGATWTPEETRRYTRRPPSDAFMAVRADHGEPASGLPDAARDFDFLIGTWDAAHRINLGGQWVSFPTTATGVYALGGRAVLEHSWFDLDPSLPDAATTILRVYNRAERRWESLYLANRGNSLLHFGGRREGDRVVLHTFGTRRTDTLSRFVFHSIEPDRYQWFAESSTDRGATFAQTWTIDLTRRGE